MQDPSSSKRTTSERGSPLGERAARTRSEAPASCEIDARGHRCPVPTLRLRKALARAAAGETVALLSDDPLARVDVPLFVRSQGHLMLSQAELPAEAGRSAAVLFRVRKRNEDLVGLAGGPGGASFTSPP